MRELTQMETKDVSGGEVATVVIAVVGVIGAACAWAYSVGKDMAERDNARDAQN